jgi:hypothetical protein
MKLKIEKQIPHPAKNGGFGMTTFRGRGGKEDVNKAGWLQTGFRVGTDSPVAGKVA